MYERHSRTNRPQNGNIDRSCIFKDDRHNCEQGAMLDPGARN